jgi:hypothetical protein
MLSILFIACLLALLTVWMHATGIALLLRYSTRARAQPPTATFAIMRTLLRVIGWLIVLHLAEVAVWAIFYLWRGCLPNAESAFYFSGVTYTTVGYGDVVLAKPWRLLAPLEGLVGILMCSLSTGYFFVVVNRILQREPRKLSAASTDHEK